MGNSVFARTVALAESSLIELPPTPIRMLVVGVICRSSLEIDLLTHPMRVGIHFIVLLRNLVSYSGIVPVSWLYS